MDSETLERAAQAVYEHIVASVRQRCVPESSGHPPSAPPGFVEIPWAALPAVIKQYWRDAVADGLAAASEGQA